jgi:hypothetical protein
MKETLNKVFRQEVAKPSFFKYFHLFRSAAEVVTYHYTPKYKSILWMTVSISGRVGKTW